MKRESRKRSRRRPHKQGKYLMPVSLLNRVIDATIALELQYPAHFVIPVLEKACDDVLGKRVNSNPDSQLLIEIEEVLTKIRDKLRNEEHKKMNGSMRILTSEDVERAIKEQTKAFRDT